jgi:hypothetical protein
MRSNKRCTTDEFVTKSKKIFGDLYDYKNVNYINNKTKVELICSEHGSFFIRPDSHLCKSYGCYLCGKNNTGIKNRNNNWLYGFEIIHGNRYDYSKVEYISNNKKVEIICKEHGSFFIKPNAHTVQKQGCYRCSRKYNDKETFIESSLTIFGETYDYSKVEYIDSHTKVEIICKEHNSFFMCPKEHINQKQGCPKCGKISMSNKHRKDIDLLMNQFKDLNGDLYDYSKVEYKNNRTKVEIICKEHGSFLQTPKSHLHGAGCPKCNISSGERKILSYLENLGIEYSYNHTFEKCKYKLPLPFDFFIPSYNLCIEFDGEQHYRPIEYFGGVDNFKRQIKRDHIKDKYCNDNKISLIRISYLNQNEISKILDNIFLINRN